MSELPRCLECDDENTYALGDLLVCPMCGHEWTPQDGGDSASSEAPRSIVDAVGNALSDGDTVTVIKDLKVKGAGGGVIKVGKKVSGIRLISDGVGDHDIGAKVPGFGQMQLKSSVVRKVVV